MFMCQVVEFKYDAKFTFEGEQSLGNNQTKTATLANLVSKD